MAMGWRGRGRGWRRRRCAVRLSRACRGAASDGQGGFAVRGRPTAHCCRACGRAPDDGSTMNGPMGEHGAGPVAPSRGRGAAAAARGPPTSRGGSPDRVRRSLPAGRGCRRRHCGCTLQTPATWKEAASEWSPAEGRRGERRHGVRRHGARRRRRINTAVRAQRRARGGGV